MKQTIYAIIIAAMFFLAAARITATPPTNPQLFGHTASEISLTIPNTTYTNVQEFINSIPIRLAILQYEMGSLSNQTMLGNTSMSVVVQYSEYVQGVFPYNKKARCKFKYGDDWYYSPSKLKQFFTLAYCKAWFKDYNNGYQELFKGHFKQANRCLNYPAWEPTSITTKFTGWGSNATIQCQTI